MESIEKMRKSHLGVKASDETKRKMSLAAIGNKSHSGRKLTQNHKLNISNALNSKNKGYYFKTEKLCKCCNTLYVAKNLGSKYCSRKCLAKDRDWSGIDRSQNNETRKKISTSLKGKYTKEKSYQWIADRTKLKDDSRERGGQLHKEWSDSVKNRDNWKCRISDENCSGRMESHHILSWKDYPELRYDTNNGICLCKYHHPRKRKEEISLIPIFQQIINNLN